MRHHSPFITSHRARPLLLAVAALGLLNCKSPQAECERTAEVLCSQRIKCAPDAKIDMQQCVAEHSAGCGDIESKCAAGVAYDIEAASRCHEEIGALACADLATLPESCAWGCFSVPAPPAAASLVGTWEGRVEVPGGAFLLILTLGEREATVAMFHDPIAEDAADNAGCTLRYEYGGEYAVEKDQLMLSGMSGALALSGCKDPADNKSAEVPADDVASVFMSLSGSFTIAEDQLTIVGPANLPPLTRKP